MECPGAAPHPFLNPFALPLVPPPLPPLPPQLASLVRQPATPRKKIKIQWLADGPQRRSTLKKRRKGIMKKAEELHILCGVKTCAIIYAVGEQEPKVWPRKEEAARMCSTFKEMPELERMRMMRTHAHFLQGVVNKKAQQMWHQHDEVGEERTRGYLYEGLLGGDLRGLSRESLAEVHAMIREMLKERYERCSALRADALAAQPAEDPQENPGDAVPVPEATTGDADPEEALPYGFL